VSLVPRSNESKLALAGFESSAGRTRDFASTNGLLLREISYGAADATAIGDLLASVDVMKILCQGQLSREEGDVGLLVAHAGRLPPGNTFAALLSGIRPHRLGWRELSNLKTASPVVFLGACSSGKLQVMGLDERISVFTSLNRAGTRTVVAPKWKIDIELALPVLDDCIQMYLSGRPLTQSLAAAASAARARGVPGWLAYAFDIEGSWT
jgi:hypothetical protein